MLNLCVLAVLIFALTFDYVTKFFSYWYVRHIPSKTSIPFFGSDYHRVLGLRTTTEEASVLCQKYPDSNFIGCVKSRIPDLIVKDPKVAELILSKDFPNFHSRGISLDKSQDVCLRNNLFYAEGEKWNLLQHNFESILKILQWKIKQNERSAHKYLHILKGEVNVKKFVQDTLSGIYTEALGFENNNGNDFSIFSLNLQDRSLVSRLKNYLKVIFPSIYTKFRLNTVSKEVSNKISRLLQHTKVFKELEKLQNHDQETPKSMKPGALISETLLSFVTESFVPCLNTITCLIYELAKNTKVQAKLRHIQNGPERNDYLDCLIKETMRIYPQHTVITRKCTKTYRFSDRDLLLDRGVTITIPVEAIHKDNKYYLNPNEFNPERFSAESVRKLPECAYLAYGAGPRRCIGK